jgi:uncharacterized protein (DUF433 family)
MTPQLQQAIAATQILSPTELLELLAAVVDKLRTPQAGANIQKTPNVCGGAACVRSTRIPVWILVQARELGNSDGEILENYPMLSSADLDNAWEYAGLNSTEIEQAIRENDEA